MARRQGGGLRRPGAYGVGGGGPRSPVGGGPGSGGRAPGPRAGGVAGTRGAGPNEDRMAWRGVVFGRAVRGGLSRREVGRPVIVPVAVVGPTATGKTALGVEIALALGGEVINADAMQLYRGMDIGTAKATPEERRGVPHHLLDVLDVTETASVAAYQAQARATIESLLERGTVPVIVGGSGLYVQAIVDDLRFPGTDPAVRKQWEERARVEGTAALHRRRAELDPKAADTILPTDTRRIVRALEVITLTGEPFSANLPEPGPPRYGTVLIGVDRAVDELDERVERRVERMFAAGLVDEVRRLE